MRGAINPFGQIQGGEAGESPQRALTAEPTLELAKRIVAHRVAHLFDFGGVVLPHETAAGIATVARLVRRKNSQQRHASLFMR